MSNRTAIITGGAHRIGAALARELHDLGLDVIIHYHKSGTAAEALVQELNALRPLSAYALGADLASTPSCATLIDQACAINQRLDVLINNAAVFNPTPAGEITESVWEEIMNINLKAPLFLSLAAAGELARASGCIINITDIHAERPLRNYTVYSISKAGLIMLTKSLAKELGPAVRVNAVSPGAIEWPEAMDDPMRRMILDRTVMKRKGDVTDISGAVRYLVNDAGYTTGQVLVVDGGRTLFS